MRTLAWTITLLATLPGPAAAVPGSPQPRPLPPGQTVLLWLDRVSPSGLGLPTYQEGETVGVRVQVRRGGFVTLLGVNAAGRTFPVEQSRTPIFVKAGGVTALDLPVTGLPRGVNRLVGVVAARPLSYARAAALLGPLKAVADGTVEPLGRPDAAQTAFVVQAETVTRPVIRDMRPPVPSRP